MPKDEQTAADPSRSVESGCAIFEWRNREDDGRNELGLKGITSGAVWLRLCRVSLSVWGPLVTARHQYEQRSEPRFRAR